MPRTRRPGRELLLGAALATLALGVTGCVERRYTIRTNVPGTLVFVNGEEIGPVPASRSFTYYGDREIVLMAPGYQTQRVIQKINAPFWDNLLTEFFTENLVPITLRDERDFSYQMVPVESPQPSDLVDRGQVLRSRANTVPPPRRGGILGWLGF
jgi:hypothetical protein